MTFNGKKIGKLESYLAKMNIEPPPKIGLLIYNTNILLTVSYTEDYYYFFIFIIIVVILVFFIIK